MKKIILSLIGVFSILSITNAQLKILTDGSAQGSRSNGELRITTLNSSGYLELGPKNPTWCHITTDRNYFYFNKRISLGTGEIEGYANKNILICAGPNSSGNYARLTILSTNGYVGIGTNYSPSYQLDVNGSIRTTGTYVTSDERLKKEIKNLEKNKISDVYKLSGKTYKKETIPINDFNTITPITQNDSTQLAKNADIDSTLQIGFLAQDIMQYYPEIVKQDKAGYLSVNYEALIPILVEAIKEQNERIAALESQLAGTKIK